MATNKMIDRVGKVEIVKGDLFSSNLQTLVNTVNCKGVMGAGIAKLFKNKYPSMFEEYKRKCASKGLQPGEPYLWKNNTGPWVLNFPTKDHWKRPSKIEWIDSGLNYLSKHYKQWGITSIAFPALGCSLGGLSWLEVKGIMLKYLKTFEIKVEIYQPSLTAAEKAIEKIKNELTEKYQDSLVGLYLCRSLSPNADEWTDWKNSNKLHICIVGTFEIDTVHLSNLSERMLKNYNIFVEFSSSTNLKIVIQLQEEKQSFIQQQMF